MRMSESELQKRRRKADSGRRLQFFPERPLWGLLYFGARDAAGSFAACKASRRVLSDQVAVLHRYGNRRMLPLAALGLGAGFIGGLLGIGGGVIIVPGLVLALHFSQHLAQGTSLTALLLMSLVGTASYLLYGHGDIVLGLQMGAGGVAGAVLGTRIAHSVNGRVLRLVFATVLIYIGLRMIIHSSQECAAAAAACAKPTTPFGWLPQLAAIGFTSGTLGSILGVAGGFITTPGLVMLLGVAQQTAQGISFSAMPFTLLVGVMAYRREASIDLRSALRVGIAGAAGVFAGTHVACNISGSALRTMFGVGLLLISIPMALKKRPKTVQASQEPATCEKTAEYINL